MIAAIGALLFVPFTVIAALELIPGRAYLRIARDGLVIRTVFKTSTWAWNDIENFNAYEIQQRYASSKHVGFDRRDLVPARQGFWKTFNRGITGVDVGLPDTYGMRTTISRSCSTPPATATRPSMGSAPPRSPTCGWRRRPRMSGATASRRSP